MINDCRDAPNWGWLHKPLLRSFDDDKGKNYLFEQSGKPDPNYATMKYDIIGLIMFLEGTGAAAKK